MSIYEHPDFRDHEQVYVLHDADSGLKAVVAIHSSVLGTATGGCRMRPYASEDEAIGDALRLSRGMTYKCAAAGLPLGGGKSVIVGDPRRDKTPDRLRAFGRYLDLMGGRYWTGEDMGMDRADFEVMREEAPYLLGLDDVGDPRGPGEVTAEGVFQAMRAAARALWGRAALDGRTVAVQGLGHVGMPLCRMLHEAGAVLVVADPDGGRVATAERVFGARPASPERVHAEAADIFAPCAIGGVLSGSSVAEIGAPAVVGSANNQLADDAVAETLRQRDVLYVPDFVANAGGVIRVGRELLAKETGGAYDRARVDADIGALYDNVRLILEIAAAEDITTLAAAEALAEERIAAARRNRRAAA